MKRTLTAFVALLLSTSLVAADTAAKKYLVATRGPAPRTIRIRSIDGDIVDRAVQPFRSVDGYAAELTDSEAAELRKSSGVRFLEPDLERHALDAFDLARGNAGGMSVETAAGSTVADSSSQTIPYGIAMVHAREVWKVSKGTPIRIGIIDTGIDRNHPELQARYRGGYDFVQNDDDPDDGAGHGTHVAGTIAAADDAVGVVGVAPDVEIYALRVLDETGSGTTSNVIRAIDWAIEHHLNILNLSLGAPTSSVLESQAFQRAADAGILAVAASGNDGGPVGFPAGYSTVVAVGAVDSSMKLASFSNIGPQLGVVAPGVKVLSTYPRGWSSVSEIEVNGTSIQANAFPQSPRADVSGSFVYCGLGRLEDIPSSVNGRIALIKRGELTFADKTRNAANAGARAVIIFDNVPDGDPSTWTLGDDPFDWPLTLGISLEDAQTLLGNPNAAIRMATRSDDYTVMSGTSMATPHVTGVAALVWSVAPTATADQVKAAIESTARDLGEGGFDTSYGFGLVDAYAAANALAPGRFVTAVKKLHTRGRR